MKKFPCQGHYTQCNTICTFCDAISHPWRIYYQTSFMLRRFIPGTKQDRRKPCTYWNLICVSLWWCSIALDVLFDSIVGSDTPRPLLPSLWRLWFTTFRMAGGGIRIHLGFQPFSNLLRGVAAQQVQTIHHSSSLWHSCLVVHYF